MLTCLVVCGMLANGSRGLQRASEMSAGFDCSSGQAIIGMYSAVAYSMHKLDTMYLEMDVTWSILTVSHKISQNPVQNPVVLPLHLKNVAQWLQ